MNKSKLFITAAAILMITALGFTQQVHKKIIKGDSDMNITHEDIMLDHTALLVDMNEEQQEKSKALHQQLDKDLMTMNADLDLLNAELKRLLIDDSPNRGAIKAKVEEIGKLKTQIHQRKIETHLAVREMLTKEQKIQFDKFSEECCLGESKQIHIIKKHVDGKDCLGDGKDCKMKIKKIIGKDADDEITVDVDVELEDE